MHYFDLVLPYIPFALLVVLGSSVLIQLFFQIFFFTRLAYFKSSSAPQTQTQPVSVIICARDEAHNLERFLPEVLQQQYSTTHEVVVVNDNSFDDSKFFLEELEKIFRTLKPINLSQEAKHIPGKKYPLSIGIKSSKYEVMLLTDADCRPASPFWIERMQHGYQNKYSIVLGYGAHEKEAGFFNKLIRFETFHTALQYLSYALAGVPYMGVGRNLSYRKQLFFDHKGFSSINHLPSGDDDLFVNKVATKENTGIVIDPESFTYSRGAKNFKQWWRQKSRHYSTARYYKPLQKFLLSLYAASYVCFLPALVAVAICFSWQVALGTLLFRWIILYWLLGRTMQKLKETDLIGWIWLLDIWQFFYYLLFSVTLFFKPRTSWK